MRNFYEAIGQNPFNHLPVTFHIKNGMADPEFTKFKAHYAEVEDEVKERKAYRLSRKNEKQINSDSVDDPK